MKALEGSYCEAIDRPSQANPSDAKGGTEMTDKKKPPDDTYARDSFSFRQMSRWQLWSITIVVIVIAVVGIAYGLM